MVPRAIDGPLRVPVRLVGTSNGLGVHRRPCRRSKPRTEHDSRPDASDVYGVLLHLSSGSQWLQVARGMSPISAGLFMLPVAAVGIFATMSASRVYGKFGRTDHPADRHRGLGRRRRSDRLCRIELDSPSGTPADCGDPGHSQRLQQHGNQNLINSVTTSADVGPRSAFTEQSSTSAPTLRPSSSS